MTRTAEFWFGPSSTTGWTCWVCSKYSGNDQSASRRHDGSLQCDNEYHHCRVWAFVHTSSCHTRDERFLTVTHWLHPRVSQLTFEADQRKVYTLLYWYLHSQGPLLAAIDRLNWFEYTDRIVLLMLGAWKHLAQSLADEDWVDASHVKSGLMLREIWKEHLDQWKLHKQHVFDAGQVYLVGKLVRRFLEVENSFLP
jgi:hypothetical protein